MSARHFHDKQIIPAGGRWKHYHSANFFHILSADGPLSVGFNEETPTPLHSGFERSPKGGFTCFEIKNNMTVAQEIEIICTDDKIRDGRMVVSGSIDANVVNFPVIQKVKLEPLTANENFVWSNWVGTAGTVMHQTLIDPALNVNGIILHYASISKGYDSIGAGIYQDTAQKSIANQTIPSDCLLAMQSNCLEPLFADLEKSFLIPAGNGLYGFVFNCVCFSLNGEVEIL